MTKKQKKMLYRIIAALALVLVLKLLPPLPVSVELLLYCIPLPRGGLGCAPQGPSGHQEPSAL